MAPKGSVKRLHYAMFVLITSQCLAFSGADIVFDFVVITSANSYDSCKQYTLTEVNSTFTSMAVTLNNTLDYHVNRLLLHQYWVMDYGLSDRQTNGLELGSGLVVRCSPLVE